MRLRARESFYRGLKEVASLRAELDAKDRRDLDEDGLEREVLAQYPDFARAVVTSRRRADTLEIGLLVESPKALRNADRERLTQWLRVRTGAAVVWVVATPAAPVVEAEPERGSLPR